MSQLKELFKEKKKILSVFVTAGYPELNSTNEIVLELERASADLIELGIPFSDPLADGPTIQRSSEIAIKKTLIDFLIQLTSVSDYARG